MARGEPPKSLKFAENFGNVDTILKYIGKSYLYLVGYFDLTSTALIFR